MSKKNISKIITGNEEENIRDCMENIKWADEIIVVDSESTDKTVEIVKEYNQKIYFKVISLSNFLSNFLSFSFLQILKLQWQLRLQYL